MYLTNTRTNNNINNNINNNFNNLNNMNVLNYTFSANAGEINYRENAQSLASDNFSQDSTSDIDRLLREVEVDAPKQEEIFEVIDAALNTDAFDNEAARQSFLDMLKRGDVIEVSGYRNKIGIPCFKVGSEKSEAFSFAPTPKDVFYVKEYIKSKKFIELPADEEGDKLIECDRDINEELFFMFLEAGEPLKILPPHKVREGMTIYPYLMGPGGKLRLRLKATEEVIDAIRNRK